MDAITKENIINDVIKKHPKTIAVFNDHRVDSCCGGGASIETTATRDGVDVSALVRDLNETVGAS